MDLPPSYDTPSAAEEIETSIDLALKLQANLLALQRSVSQLDDSASTVSGAAVHYYERYASFLGESRTSAIELSMAIRSFLGNTIPISLSDKYPLEQRVNSVRSTAEKIRSTSQKNQLDFKKSILEIMKNFGFFLVPLIDTRRKATKQSLTLAEKEAGCCEDGSLVPGQQNHAIFDQWRKWAGPYVTTFRTHISEINDPHLSESFELLHLPPDHKRNGAKTFFPSPKIDIDHTKCNEICQMRDSSELQKLKQDMRMVGSIHDQHKALLDEVEKLKMRNDPFQVCWKKLEEDAYMLSDYMSDPHGTFQEDDLMERIQSEGPVYERIQRALDYYALKV